MSAKAMSGWQLALLWVVLALISVGAVVTFVYAVRQLSSATTGITVVEAEPGVRCAKAVTGDGVAIDCWSVKR